MMDRVQLGGREDEAAPAGFMEGRFFVGETSSASSRSTPRWSRTSKSNAAVKSAAPNSTTSVTAVVSLQELQNAQQAAVCQVDGLKSNAAKFLSGKVAGLTT